MKRNFLLTLLLTLLPLASWSVENPTTFDALKAAVAAAEDGATIQIGENIDWTEEGAWELDLQGKTLAIDMNEYQLTGRLNFYNGDLTIANGTFSNDTQPLNVYGLLDPEAEGYSVLTIAPDATVMAGQEGNAVCLFGQSLKNDGYGAVINIYGTVEVDGGDAVFVSGNLGNNNSVKANLTKSPVYVAQAINTDAEAYEESVALMAATNIINIYEGAKVYSYGSAGVVINGAATVNMTGGLIESGTGFCIKRGTLNVEDGTVIGWGTMLHPTVTNNNGSEPGGDAITISPTYAKYGQIAVNISGGNFYSDQASGIYQSTKVEALVSYPNGTTFNISGGTFINRGSVKGWEGMDYSFETEPRLIEVYESNPTQFITGGVYTEDPSEYVPTGYMVVEEQMELPTYADNYLNAWNVRAFEAPVAPTTELITVYRVVKVSELVGDLSWTMDPVEGYYKAAPYEPTITVSQKIEGVRTPLPAEAWDAYGITVKYFSGLTDDGEVDPETEVDEMLHAGEYYVQVGIQNGDEFTPFGAKYKPFTIKRAPIELRLAQIDVYFHEKNGKADYLVPSYQGSDGLNNVKIVNIENIDVTQENWWFTEDPEDGQIYPIDWEAAGEFPITLLQNFELSSEYVWYSIQGKKNARAFVIDGNKVYEDYDVKTVTSAEAKTRKNEGRIELTMEEGQLTKIYGEKDPAGPYAYVYDEDGDDMSADDYSTEEFPCNVEINISREKEGLYEDAGSYDVYVDVTGSDAGYYEFSGSYDDTEEIEGGTRYIFKDAFTITEYDITEAEVEEDAKKVIIAVDDVVYDGTYQQVKPSSVIFLDVEDVLAPVDGNAVTSNEYVEGTDELGAHVILAENAGEEGDWTLAYVDPETGKGTQKTKVSDADAAAGKYTYWYNRQVSRQADGTVNEKKGEVQIMAVDASKNFIGYKFGNFTVTPRDLHILANATAGFGTTPVFTLVEAETEATDDGFVVDEETGVMDKFTTTNVDLVIPRTVVVTLPDGYEGNEGTYAVTAALKEGVNRTKTALNYNPIFDGGSLNVTSLEIDFAAADQTIKYSDVVQADESYLLPDETTGTWTNLGDGKSVVLDVDVAGIVTTSMPLPAGYSISDFVELTCDVTAQGVHTGALVLTKKATAPANVTVKSVTNGDLTIEPLDEIHLAYKNVSQALEDHKGYGGTDAEPMTVYMPKRQLKTDQWYGMVLPFDMYVPELSTKVGYASAALLKETPSGSNDVYFDTKVTTITANTPFLVKVAPANKADQGEKITISKTDLAAVSFENVKIGDNAKYNGTEEEDPFVETHEGGPKFIGSYKTIEAWGDYWLAKKEFSAKEAYLHYHDGKFYKANTEANKTHEMFTTDAYLSFPTEFAAREASIFIEEEDGTVTAIEGIGAEPADIAASKSAEGIYNLSGQRVDKAQKGIYIKDGKKVLVK